jgi:FAD/FMN-containing dehydrogenase/Fe-S oxidoreductase
MEQHFARLAGSLEGDLCLDMITRTAYATDASIYRELPMAVALPGSVEDIRRLILFAREHQLSIIPRTAGTSLAGQVVGSGIVTDVSRYMTRILEVNEAEGYVWVEPGVILDELNRFLQPKGLMFGPETSTSNRCMIGGMLGNNSCGLHSLVYGSTREHTLAVKAILSDGTDAEFSALNREEFLEKCSGNSLESRVYDEIRQILSHPGNRKAIRDNYPDPSVPRRNNGYALDLLLDTAPFVQEGKPFNLCTLLGGSEGTLAFFTAIKLNLVPLPPSRRALVCAHFHNMKETLSANLVALSHQPTAVELMDHVVLECTRDNHTQQANRFFLSGTPHAILIIEFAEETTERLEEKIRECIDDLSQKGLGYAYPVVYGNDIRKVWDLRKAGLGSLANIPGDDKSVTVIEDAAVPVEKLGDYVEEIGEMLDRHGKDCVFHAHVGTGELHLRPVMNLKKPGELVHFREIAAEAVDIVKKYRGSLSGEHGDGRLRAPLLPNYFGDEVYGFLLRVKQAFDPGNLFNPAKITSSRPIDESLRTSTGLTVPDIPTWFDFSATSGFVRTIEKCNGSGDCRKTPAAGGGMCPSYQATLDENSTTRARANILREFILKPGKGNPFDHNEIYTILDLCLSCKACKSECPSNVDMARLKAEFLQHWHEVHPPSMRTRMIAFLPDLYRRMHPLAGLVNLVTRSRALSGWFKRLSGFHPRRSVPRLSHLPVEKWIRRNILTINPSSRASKGFVYFFADEFTNYLDTTAGILCIRLLNRLGYGVRLAGRSNSGRTLISKGLVKRAAREALRNILLYKDLVSEDHPLVGLEPSAILGFRDEFPDLAGPGLRDQALELGRNCLMVEEFLEREMKAGRVTREEFTNEGREILLHGHCHQKSLASVSPTLFVLNFPENYTCKEIPSGCCGMAGAFGFEKEHFELSMKVGELVLFPAVRAAAADTTICAPGTSCRHQILDGTGKKALHPVEILWEALREK